MNKKILSSLLCTVVLCVCVFGFVGCGAKQYSYSEFVEGYHSLIDTYSVGDTSTISIFDSQGNVDIAYPNQKLRDAISSNTVEDYRLMFTRLTADANSNQALFEPAFKASLLYINKYIDSETVTDVPLDVSDRLYAKLADFSSKLKTFNFNLLKFDVRADSFDKTSLIDQSFLSHLLDSYYQMILSSCALTLDFIDVANTYIWTSVPESDTGRLPAGVIERYYLAELTESVDTYARFSLVSYYNQAYVVGGEEYYTAQEPSKGINAMLTTYEANKSSLVNFENRYNAGEMNSLEQKVVDAYHDAVEYDALYNSAYQVASISLSRAGNMTHDLDEAYDPNSAMQAHKRVVEAFYLDEFANKVNLLLDILVKVSAVA